MKKLQLLNILLILSMATAFGQTNHSELESQNEKLKLELIKKDEMISTQRNDIKDMKEEIQYYKQTMDLLNSKMKSEGNNIIFKINSVLGKSDLGKIIIEGLVENNGVIGRFKTKDIELTDPKGNIYKPTKITYGGERFLSSFQKNIPVKVVIEFDQIIEETPIMKAMVWTVYGGARIGEFYTVIFKNLSVEWK